MPSEWYSAEQKRATPVRVVAIGHGGLFADETWSTAREKVLLDTCNWLLGRDDLLSRDDRAQNPETEWRYPRLNLEAQDRALWQWGLGLGLPVLCLYLGVLVLLMRRMS